MRALGQACEILGKWEDKALVLNPRAFIVHWSFLILFSFHRPLSLFLPNNSSPCDHLWQLHSTHAHGQRDATPASFS